MSNILGGTDEGTPDYSGPVKITGGSVNNVANGVMYIGDDGSSLFFEGVQVQNNSWDQNSAYQFNGTIAIGESWRENGFDINVLSHEYGHYLQQELYGTSTYLVNVALPSVYSATVNPSGHYEKWFELDATKRGQEFLKNNLIKPNNNYTDPITTAYAPPPPVE